MDPMDHDPACWTWPVPATITFDGDIAAENFLKWWNHLCAVCGESGVLVKDHDHATMLVRGYLCNPCNILECHRKDGVIARYRRRTPAQMLGIEIRYRRPPTYFRVPAPEHREDVAQMGRRVAAYLRQARIAAGLSQREVAERLREQGLPFRQQTVNEVERNNRALTFPEGVVFAEIFGLDGPSALAEAAAEVAKTQERRAS